MISKIKIVVDVREIFEKPAGVGRIIAALTNAISDISKDSEIKLAGSSEYCPLGINGEYFKISGTGFLWHLKCAQKVKANPQWGTYISIRSPLVPIMVPGRSVYFVNDLISFKYPEYFTLKTRIIESLFVKLALKRVKRIVAISNSTAKDIEKLCPEAKKRITVIYLAADPEFKKLDPDPEVLKKYGIKGPYILTVGTIEPRKNHTNLLLAYNSLPEKIRNKYKLVIVGKRGWKCDKIIERIKEAEKTGSVMYLEFVPDRDLVHIYNGADLFAYPSLYEGFGLPVVEAMSCGVPTITSNTSSMPEVGGRAAIYFNPENPEEIMRAMMSVLADDHTAKQMSQAGLVQAHSFSWGKTAEAVMKLIDAGL